MEDYTSNPNTQDASPDVIEPQTWDQLVTGASVETSPGSQTPQQPVYPTKTIVQVATDYQSPNYKQGTSGWKLGSNGVIEAVGIKAQTSSTVDVGGNGVVLDEDGLRGYNATFGEVFNIPTDGSAPTFSSGVITESVFEINTNAVLRTSSTAGDGSTNSAGVLINNTGVYGMGANQTTADANVRIRTEGTLFVGDADNYLSWDGTYLRLKGSFDVGSGGVINNSVYTVATLPSQPTTVGFNNPAANSAY